MSSYIAKVQRLAEKQTELLSQCRLIKKAFMEYGYNSEQCSRLVMGMFEILREMEEL